MNQRAWRSPRRRAALGHALRLLDYRFGGFSLLEYLHVLGALGAKALGNPASWDLTPRCRPVPRIALAATDDHVPAHRGGNVDWPSPSRDTLVAAGVPIIASVLVAVIFGWRER